VRARQTYDRSDDQNAWRRDRPPLPYVPRECLRWSAVSPGSRRRECV